MLVAGVLSVAVAAFFAMRRRSGGVSTGLTRPAAPLDVPASNFELLTGFSDGFSGIMQSLNLASAPRGIRNNNPLNIKWVSFQTWNGQTGVDDAGFVIFDKPENGIRAGVRTLTSYRNAGYVTPRQIITRWTGGDSSAIQNSYIAHVSSALGIAESAEVPASRWFDLIKVMIKHENGQQPYNDAQIRAGIASA